MIELTQTYGMFFLLLIIAGAFLDDICVRLNIFQMLAPPLSLAMIIIGALGTLINFVAHMYSIPSAAC